MEYMNLSVKDPRHVPSVLYELEYKGLNLKLFDAQDSQSIPCIMNGLKDGDYNLDNLPSHQTKILDIGAHIGITSIILSKMFPNSEIFAVEPFPMNFQHLIHNIKLNQCLNITPIPIAVTGDGRRLAMGAISLNTGSASSRYGFASGEIPSSTLNNLFDTLLHSGEVFSFVKMDIEGLEYEVLDRFTQWYRIRDLSLEMHELPGDEEKPDGWWERLLAKKEIYLKKQVLGSVYIEP